MKTSLCFVLLMSGVQACSQANPDPAEPTSKPTSTASTSAKPMLSEKELADLESSCGEAAILLCVDLGMRFRDGDGVPASREKALHYLSFGCDYSVAWACTSLSTLLLAGPEAPDFDRLFKIHLTACQPGMTDTCHTLGDMWRDGNKVPQDAGRARQLYEAGCEWVKAAEKDGCAEDYQKAECEQNLSCKRLAQ